jgi:hypothetical protein
LKLEKLADQAGLPLSTFALLELTETARRADHAELLNALPSPPIERDSRFARAPGLPAPKHLVETETAPSRT